MHETSPRHAARLVDLDEAECCRLAATEPVGRLAWTGPRRTDRRAGQLHRSTDGSVHIRTAAYSALARECDDSRVAFEVDAFDADSRLRLERADASAAPPRLRQRRRRTTPEVWPVGSKAAAAHRRGRRRSPAAGSARAD